jgi:hypothetical protein
VAGVVAGGREAAGITAVAEHVGGDDRPDAVQFGERGARRVGVSDADDVVGELAVQPAHLRQQLAGEHLAFNVDRGRRLDPGKVPDGPVGP